jgi:CAAX prenyl protease-like protein
LGELQLQQADELFRIGLFGLAVAVGIHRERSLTIQPKHLQMDSEPAPSKRKLVAFTLPMAVFLALLGLLGALRKGEGGALGPASPEYWLYPAQTLICGALLLWFWRQYDLGAPRRILFATGVALVVFALWIAPQQFFGFPPRLVGFDPEVFTGQPAMYWTTVIMRFVRLVVVVPLVEEIFWRGFLLRYLINERFTAVPVGAFSWISFAVVTLAFGFGHARPDWIAALMTGALYNLVAYRTRSLASCVVAHAVTNCLLGVWIMSSRQWGFW